MRSAAKYSIAPPPPTYYSWKAKFGGMSVSEAQRLKALEEENRKLKRPSSCYALGNVALKDLLSKKVVSPQAKRKAMNDLIVNHGISQKASLSFARF